MGEETSILIIISSGLVLYIILIIKYLMYLEKNKEKEEFENHIKEYKNYMKATGKNTLKDISVEFSEDISIVEENVRRAIRINLLKGYYLCNQTGEILPINSDIFSLRKSITIKENKSIKIKE